MGKISKTALTAMLAAVLSMMFTLNASAITPLTKGSDIYALQAMLQSLGYYSGQIDGQYGTVTAQSVAAYQAAAGISATGEIDAATFRSILQAYSRVKTAELDTSHVGQADGSSDGGDRGLTMTAAERQMVDLVNAARKEANVPPLAANPELSRVARFKSEDMAAGGYFSHDSPTYGSPFQMMEDFGISFSAAAENIACNQTVEWAHAALMNSQGHRANILNPDYTEIGIGIVDGGPCGAMYTQMFLRP